MPPIYIGDREVTKMYLGATEITQAYLGDVSLVVDGGGGSNGLLTDLEAYWKLDEASTGSRADSHSNGYDLTATNSPGYGTGVISNCVVFGNGDMRLASLGYTGVTGTAARGVSMWFKTSSSENMCLIGYGATASGTNGTIWRVGIENGVIVIRIYGGMASWGSGYADDAWHHLVVTHAAGATGGQIKIYVDGSEVSIVNTTSQAINTSSDAPVTLGNDPQTTPQQFLEDFAGSMDEVGLWSRQLDSDDVTALYNSGSGLPYGDFD